MKLSEIATALDAVVLVGQELLDKEISRAGASDLMSDVLAGLSEGSILLTGLATIQTIRTAIVAEIDAVILVRNKKPAQEIIDQAKYQNIPLLSTPYSMFVSCGRLHAMGITGLDGKR